MKISTLSASTSRSRPRPVLISFVVVLTTTISIAVSAQSPDVPDTADSLERIAGILRRFDDQLQGSDGRWQLTISQRPLLVVTDVNARRMRIMTPVAEAASLTQEQLYRLMQANFESALDARYAISQGQVWAAFIHPLHGLTDDELISAIAQTVTLAETYGTSFSSGALSYGGGDHGGQIFESLREKGTLL